MLQHKLQYLNQSIRRTSRYIKLGSTQERITNLHYTMSTIGLEQLGSVNIWRRTNYWLVTQVPPRIVALIQFKQCTKYTQYSAGQPIPRELLPSPTPRVLYKANGG